MPTPRPEHPNPQFQRQDWINLNGEWDFEYDNENSGFKKGYYKPDFKFTKKIIVPFCPESKLSGIGNTDFIRGVWYKKDFDLPLKFKGKKLRLHIGACDFLTQIYVNGELKTTHKGGYTPFYVDLDETVTEKPFNIAVYAEDDTRSPLQSSGKQSPEYESHGCFYTRTTGIWQTVWAEILPENYIQSVKYYPSYENGTLTLQAEVCGRGLFEATAVYDGKIMGYASAKSESGSLTITLDLEEKHLWEIGHGRLYNLELKFAEDEVTSYFGLRNIEIDGMKFRLNGKSIFQRLVLDQGYYPDGIYTAADEEALINDISISMDAGFNGARLHEKIFEPRFLYHCDRMGYIVWGEYPNWGLDHSRADSVFTILPEWIDEINRDFNHPSIIGWTPFNETWDQHGCKQDDNVLETVYRVTKALDPTRPCIDTSGNFHVATDIFDVHDYEQNAAMFKANYDKLMESGELYDRFENIQHYELGQPTFVSEYGGIRWSLSEVMNAWGYGDTPHSEKEFIERYKGLTDALIDNDKMIGFCYTQLYDVEQEQNGLYLYSREPKFDMSIFKEINSRKAKIED